MHPLIISTIAAEQLRDEHERAARARLVRKIRLGARSAVRPAAGRSPHRHLRPRASRAAA